MKSPGQNSSSRVSEFARLTAPWQRQLYGLAVTLCKDLDQAADMTQETLVRAFQAFGRFRPGAPIFPWLASILRNLHLDICRSGRARYEVLENQLGRDMSVETMLTESSPRPADPLSLVELAQLRCWLREEIERLPTEQRLIVTLCDINGLKYGEAAEAADIPIGTVRSRLSRARLILRRRLQERAFDVECAGPSAEAGTTRGTTKGTGS